MALERAARVFTLGRLGQVVLAISLFHTREVLVQLELLESTTGDEKTSAVGSSPVGETVADTVCLQLVGVRSREDLVAGELRADDLDLLYC